jgi:hypothetical protein
VSGVHAGEWITLLVGLAAIPGALAAIYRGRVRLVLVVSCGLLAVAGIAVAIVSSLDGGGGATSPQASPSSQASPPSTSKSSEPGTPSPNPTPPVPFDSNATQYRLELQDNTYVDLDTRAVALDDGPNFDVLFLKTGSVSFLGALNSTKLVIVQDQDAYSFQGCAGGTRLQPSSVLLHNVKDNESICVSTHQGAWAALKQDKTVNSTTYDAFVVRVYRKPPGR